MSCLAEKATGGEKVVQVETLNTKNINQLMVGEIGMKIVLKELDNDNLLHFGKNPPFTTRILS
jgi:hypothetical protein